MMLKDLYQGQVSKACRRNRHAECRGRAKPEGPMLPGNKYTRCGCLKCGHRDLA